MAEPPRKKIFPWRLCYFPSVSVFQRGLFLDLTRSVGDNHVVDLGLMAVTLVELLGHRLDERVMERIGNEVDGTAAETAAHYT